jgi:RNA polymerase sigma factor (sigma-70 family)
LLLSTSQLCLIFSVVTIMSDEPITPIQRCLNLLAIGDPGARESLYIASRNRLLALTRRMLSQYPGVKRWEGSDDVFQNVLVQLHHCLAEVHPPSTLDLLRLTAHIIKRELINLARHYSGPQGLGTHHSTPNSKGQNACDAAVAPKVDLGRAVEWIELLEQVNQFPATEREAFDLLWCQGLSQEEAAKLLGLSVRTVKRRWLATRLHLAAIIGHNLANTNLECDVPSGG